MNDAAALYISGCKDHPGTTDLSCCRIRRADGTPLDIREVWAVIQKMEATRAELEEQRRELLEALKSAIEDWRLGYDHNDAGSYNEAIAAIARAEGRA